MNLIGKCIITMIRKPIKNHTLLIKYSPHWGIGLVWSCGSPSSLVTRSPICHSQPGSPVWFNGEWESKFRLWDREWLGPFTKFWELKGSTDHHFAIPSQGVLMCDSTVNRNYFLDCGNGNGSANSQSFENGNGQQITISPFPVQKSPFILEFAFVLSFLHHCHVHLFLPSPGHRSGLAWSLLSPLRFQSCWRKWNLNKKGKDFVNRILIDKQMGGMSHQRTWHESCKMKSWDQNLFQHNRQKPDHPTPQEGTWREVFQGNLMKYRIILWIKVHLCMVQIGPGLLSRLRGDLRVAAEWS